MSIWMCGNIQIENQFPIIAINQLFISLTDGFWDNHIEVAPRIRSWGLLSWIQQDFLKALSRDLPLEGLLLLLESRESIIICFHYPSFIVLSMCQAQVIYHHWAKKLVNKRGIWDRHACLWFWNRANSDWQT